MCVYIYNYIVYFLALVSKFIQFGHTTNFKDGIRTMQNNQICVICKRKGGSWEHAEQGDRQPTFKPVIPPLPKAGSVRCSVTHLTRCPPL
jgi:hypothetical protein